MSTKMKEVFLGWVKIVTSAFSSASFKQALFKVGHTQRERERERERGRERETGL